jgi:predicted pyridoxine 5'-phosphate oxidase superfamily flavin-nucleotide-binding protein
MSYGFLDIAVTPSVRAVQAKMGGDRIWQDFKGHREFDCFTEDEAAFIADRDSFYMATVSETGWPYVQHRGGPRGFLKVVDEKTLAFSRLSRQPPIHQHRQPSGRSPGLPVSHGLPSQGAA